MDTVSQITISNSRKTVGQINLDRRTKNTAADEDVTFRPTQGKVQVEY